MFAIGQKIRETVGAGFIAIDGGDLGGRAARSGNREQAGLIGRRKEIDAGSIPGAAAASGGVGDYRDGAAGKVDAFEFLVGEKAEGAAVGGPERRGDAVVADSAAPLTRIARARKFGSSRNGRRCGPVRPEPLPGACGLPGLPVGIEVPHPRVRSGAYAFGRGESARLAGRPGQLRGPLLRSGSTGICPLHPDGAQEAAVLADVPCRPRARRRRVGQLHEDLVQQRAGRAGCRRRRYR